MKLATLVFLLASLSVVAPASARTVLLGRSWQGRPIRAVEVGHASGTRVLVVGCIHGNETAGIAIADALEHVAPRDLDLWIVPDLNPDGVAAGTRQNAHGVDLNRNFPWRWRPMSGVYASGPRPLSEREARIAHALILRYSLDLDPCVVRCARLDVKDPGILKRFAVRRPALGAGMPLPMKRVSDTSNRHAGSSWNGLATQHRGGRAAA
jgi:hypothetical protein